MTRKTACQSAAGLTVALVVIGGAIAGFVWWSGRDANGEGASAAEMAKQREQLDQTVWADEIKAQIYEQTFVKLWDNLRAADDKLAILAAVPLESLSYNTEGETETFNLGIRRTTLGDAPEKLSGEQFRARIEQLRSAGYRVVETEWHHSQFIPNAPGGPRSIVSTALHVEQIRAGEPPRRVIVRADLHIQWSPETDADGRPTLAAVAVRNLRILERSGGPLFEKLMTISGENRQSLSAHPILVYDLDGNGRSEILLPRWNRVYWNDGQGRFRSERLLEHPQELWETGILADFNGDGAADFVSVTKGGYPVLFAGNKYGFFTVEGVRCADVRFDLPSAITAGDVDGDGDLDLWMTQYKRAYDEGQMPTPYYDANDGFPSYLLLNDGQGKFRDATLEAGLDKQRFRRSYSASLVDLDDDDDLDLMVVSDFSGLDLYENDGRGHFTEASERWVGPRHSFGMGHTLADYDLDGALDFYVIGMSSTTARRLDQLKLGRQGREDIQRMRKEMGYGNRMYLRRGPRYEAPRFAANVARTGWSWGTTSQDFDNDGDKDIYVANGNWSGDSAQDYCTRYWCHDVYTGTSQANAEVKTLLYDSLKDLNTGRISWNGFEKNALLLNVSRPNGDGRDFVNVAFLFGVSFVYDSRAVVADDLDGDGRVDLLVAQFTWTQYTPNSKGFEMDLNVYRNQIETDNHWIGVQLREEGPGRSPIGAKISVQVGGRKHVGRIVTGDSFLAQHANTVHFGIGQAEKVDSLEVQWPDGTRTVLRNPAIDQYHRLRPEK